MLSLQIYTVGSISQTEITELKDMGINIFAKSCKLLSIEVTIIFTPTKNMCESVSFPIPSLILGFIGIIRFLLKKIFCHVMTQFAFFLHK